MGTLSPPYPPRTHGSPMSRPFKFSAMDDRIGVLKVSRWLEVEKAVRLGWQTQLGQADRKIGHMLSTYSLRK